MMLSTIISEINLPLVGLRMRTPTPGPEGMLVDGFLRFLEQNPDHPRGLQRVIFVEPFLAHSAPDVVVVDYDPRTYEEWHRPGSLRVPGDLKFMHHLWSTRGGRVEEIAAATGNSLTVTERALERLLHISFARRRGPRWEPVALSQIFGVRRIVAVEAKIFGVRRAARQATHNRWFASESIVLTNAHTVEDDLFKQLQSTGVGVVVQNGFTTAILTPTASPMPASYGSWLFNEWIGAIVSM